MTNEKPLIYKVDEKVSNINESNFSVSVLSEQFKTKNNSDNEKLLTTIKKNAGEPHPFDYKIIDGLEKKFGLVNSIEDKFADYVFGSGIFIDCEDDEAKDLLENWMNKKYLIMFLRRWFKHALGKGSGYLEIAGLDNENEDEQVKNIDPSSIYIKINEYGETVEINQILDNQSFIKDSSQINSLPMKTIIPIHINEIGNSVYGYGIVYSALSIIDNFLASQNSIHQLMKRKANSQIHVKLGNVEKEDYPKQKDIDAFGRNLQYMNESTEWVTGPNVEMKVLDFGNIGEKYKDVLDNDMKLLSYAFQVPEAILGAEKSFVGATKIQDEGFDRKIRAYQEKIGFILKTKIFDLLLEKNGYSKVDYSIMWGKQSEEDKNALRDSYQKLLGSNVLLSPGMKEAYEKKLALLDNIDYKEVEGTNVKQMRRENRQSKKEFSRQVQLAQQNNKQSNEHAIHHEIEDLFFQGLAPQEIESEIIKDYNLTESYSESLVAKELDELNKDYTLKEWVGEYVHIKKQILERIAGDNFEKLTAKNAQERALGLLNKKQVEQLRDIMSKAFEENKGLKQVSKEIKEIGLKDRYILKDGKKILKTRSDKRAYQIARTESVRLRAEGTLISFSDKGKNKVEFTTQSMNPCPECEGLNGNVYTVDEAFGVIPVHSGCRCQWKEG